MRLGDDVVVLTQCAESRTIAFLSRNLNANKQVCWDNGSYAWDCVVLWMILLGYPELFGCMHFSQSILLYALCWSSSS